MHQRRAGHHRIVTLALGAVLLAAAAAGAASVPDGPIPAPPPRSSDASAALSAPGVGTLMAPAAPTSAPALALAALPAAPRTATDPFALPLDYKTADGAFNEDAIVACQRLRLAAINDRLHIRLKLTETPHYLIFSDADTEVTTRFATWSEALYGRLCSEFSIDPKKRVWDGKCVLTVFAARAKFEAFARSFDDQDVRDAGAYFAHERFGPSEPNLVHMCIPSDDKTPRRLEELFAHEGTHAFFQLYRKPVTLPLWLHEGLAEYMTVVNDPSLGPLKSGAAKAAVKQKTSIASLFKQPVAKPLSHVQYSISYTLVDYLQKSGRDKFIRFVDLMKDGQTADAALTAVYGFDTAGLADRWRASLSPDSPAPKPRAI